MKRIVIAGATGNIGSKVVQHLVQKQASIRALVRAETEKAKKDQLAAQGVEIQEINLLDKAQVSAACAGADCVLSMLSGLEDVIVDTQKVLLDGAIAAGVRRFIPSDFSIDFRDLVYGKNRNLDYRKKFYAYVNDQPVKATTIFTGALMDLLKTDMPLILKKYKRILCWGDRDQKMEFTHSDDIAAFTADVCLDDKSPRHLFIAGDVLSCNDFVQLMTTLTGEQYKILKPGGIGLLNTMIKITKVFSPGKNEIYPPWQGMQYMRDMMEGRVQLQAAYSNQRYDDRKFIDVKEFLTQ